MKRLKILAIDDDDQIQKLLSRGLQGYGYQVITAGHGSDGLALAAQQSPDMVILDVQLGRGLNGLDVSRDLRQWSKVPLIMLSVQNDKETKLAALDAGADDYVIKPFDMEELEARIRAILRRSVMADPATPTAEIKIHDLVIDLAKRRIHLGDEEIHLTPKEFEILRLLATHPGKVMTYRTLLIAVWSEKHAESEHYVRVFVNTIRKKLHEDLSDKPRFIITEPGVGYRFVDF